MGGEGMKLALAALAAALALSGCASIISGSTQPVIIKSVPDGASITVSNRAGEKIHTATTPATLTLARGAGYFKPEQYKVVITKDGFADKEITITGTLNGWYIGNIIFGGLIGMLLVDPATGAMYAMPETVEATLDGKKQATAPTSTLTIMSTADVSAATLAQARLLTAAK
jgi:hypothetical protein